MLQALRSRRDIGKLLFTFTIYHIMIFLNEQEDIFGRRVVNLFSRDIISYGLQEIQHSQLTCCSRSIWLSMLLKYEKGYYFLETKRSKSGGGARGWLEIQGIKGQGARELQAYLRVVSLALSEKLLPKLPKKVFQLPS